MSDAIRPRPRRGEVREFFEANLMVRTPDCKIWPYDTSNVGYPRIHIRSQSERMVHVLACIAFHGPPPLPGMNAAHGPCHTPACWNGDHLSWKTAKENSADRLRDGTHYLSVTAAKLSETDVRTIRHLAATGAPRAVLAETYGLHPVHVGGIIRRRYWKHVE